jgi:hypothetical protein
VIVRESYCQLFEILFQKFKLFILDILKLKDRTEFSIIAIEVHISQTIESKSPIDQLLNMAPRYGNRPFQHMFLEIQFLSNYFISAVTL